MKSAEEYFGQYAYKSYATLEKAIYLPELETIIKADRQQVREMVEGVIKECEKERQELIGYGNDGEYNKSQILVLTELLNKLQELK